MRILEWDEFLKEGPGAGDKPAAVTVGVFDGVHRGHRELIQRITLCGQMPVVVTFRNNHKKPGHSYPGDITRFGQKAALFESMGAAVTVAADLSESFRRMSGADFFRLLRERGNMGFLAVGSNFRCGHNLDTDAPMIQQLNAAHGIPVDIVETLTEEGLPISSSRIRKAIAQGNLAEAAVMLGRPFAIDLSGADIMPHKNSCTDIVCRIADLGYVLPPPGRYAVLIYGENCAGKQAQIQIEDGLLRLPAVQAFSRGRDIRHGIRVEFVC